MIKLVEPAIYELLKTLAGGRVYALRAEQNTPTPFVIFNRTGSDRWRAINGPSGIAQAYVQVDAYGADYYEAKELAAEIEDILDGYSGTVTYGSDSPADFVKIGGVSLENDVDLLEQAAEPFLYRNSMSFLVTYEQ
jgi:hypothetical protein